MAQDLDELEGAVEDEDALRRPVRNVRDAQVPPDSDDPGAAVGPPHLPLHRRKAQGQGQGQGHEEKGGRRGGGRREGERGGREGEGGGRGSGGEGRGEGAHLPQGRTRPRPVPLPFPATARSQPTNTGLTKLRCVEVVGREGWLSNKGLFRLGMAHAGWGTGRGAAQAAPDRAPEPQGRDVIAHAGPPRPQGRGTGRAPGARVPNGYPDIWGA